MMAFADSVELAHIGLWTAPFDRLIGLNGLTDSQRQQILDHYDERLQATIASRDLFRITRTGRDFAKYFYDRRNYTRAKEITVACGEAALEIASAMNASIAVYHIGKRIGGVSTSGSSGPGGTCSSSPRRKRQGGDRRNETAAF